MRRILKVAALSLGVLALTAGTASAILTDYSIGGEPSDPLGEEFLLLESNGQPSTDGSAPIAVFIVVHECTSGETFVAGLVGHQPAVTEPVLDTANTIGQGGATDDCASARGSNGRTITLGAVRSDDGNFNDEEDIRVQGAGATTEDGFFGLNDIDFDNEILRPGELVIESAGS